MVISAPTYHIVSNVLPETAGGRHKIGTIVDNLQVLTPLNEYEEIEIPNVRRFCTHEPNFKATRDQILKGSGGVGVKLAALQVPVGGEIGGGGNNSVDDSYNCVSLDTEWIYPTKDDYIKAVKSVGLQDYLTSSKYASVYIITGIKTGRQPSIALKRSSEIEGHTQLGIDMGGWGNIGPRGDGSKTRNTMQSSEGSSDIVIGVRVRKLSYKKQYWLFGKRILTDKPYDEGAEMVGENRAKDLKEDYDVDELELEEEMEGSVKIDEQEPGGEIVTWVVPEIAR
ncbi:hypothetical protein CC86DRAFT_372543 [Ophiobolus disseminans]|uniref:Uncharacterized protein n=1 Tax=Ophiobolus disseminans TaxID=1469910 RepID=A0A6A6ZRZ9_9PLEO|nr:hypothetical protein CC86DRAFT_372543 [Ophiobolus disseminans]